MGKITHIKCLIPFTRLNIHHHGFCYSCCPSWNKLGNIGKLTDIDSIMDIWNSPSIVTVRKAILNDKLSEVCNFKNCPIAIKNQNIDLLDMKNNNVNDINPCHTIDLIKKGEYIMDKPPQFVQISNFGKCNLKCVMCQVNDKILNTNHEMNEKLFNRVIKKILPDISIFSLSGSGEVFYNRYTREFLQTLDNDSYPSLKIELYTNGLLFTQKLWQTKKHN